MPKQNVKEIVDFIKDSVKWLVEEDQGCCTHELDSQIGVIVGWMPGYDTDPNDGDIHSKEDPSYCINVGLGVYISDYMCTDMEFINQPYWEDSGDVWDTQYTLGVNYSDESLEADVKWLLKEYDEMCKYEITDSGEILGHRIVSELDSMIEEAYTTDECEEIKTKIEEAELDDDEREHLLDYLQETFDYLKKQEDEYEKELEEELKESKEEA